ncbi:hypothetical protein [Acidaminococcus sp.]|uniref:hypothetical protein n=1 Tax=Acidaminococcus sp. TaxID=1872103 RepID=UPI003D7D562A
MMFDCESDMGYQIDQLQRDLDKDEEYIAKLEEENQRLEYQASKAEALEEENHRKDQTIQQYQDYIRELVQSVESQQGEKL